MKQETQKHKQLRSKINKIVGIICVIIIVLVMLVLIFGFERYEINDVLVIRSRFKNKMWYFDYIKTKKNSYIYIIIFYGDVKSNPNEITIQYHSNKPNEYLKQKIKHDKNQICVIRVPNKLYLIEY